MCRRRERSLLPFLPFVPFLLFLLFLLFLPFLLFLAFLPFRPLRCRLFSRRFPCFAKRGQQDETKSALAPVLKPDLDLPRRKACFLCDSEPLTRCRVRHCLQHFLEGFELVDCEASPRSAGRCVAARHFSFDLPRRVGRAGKVVRRCRGKRGGAVRRADHLFVMCEGFRRVRSSKPTAAARQTAAAVARRRTENRKRRRKAGDEEEFVSHRPASFLTRLAPARFTPFLTLLTPTTLPGD